MSSLTDILGGCRVALENQWSQGEATVTSPKFNSEFTPEKLPSTQ